MYSNAQYEKNADGVVCTIRVEKAGLICYIPLDPANTDYANVMALVESGELVVAPADPE